MSKRRKSPWFAFYASDYVQGARSMTLAAQGAYVALLCEQFDKGVVPSDDRAICRILGVFPDEWESIRDEVLAKFEEVEGGLANARMAKEREEREGIRKRRIEAANKRWENEGGDASASAKGMQVHLQNGCKRDASADASACVLHDASTSTSTSTSKTSPKEKTPPQTREPKLPHGDKFAETWKLWQDFRKQKRSKLTPITIERQLAKLAKLDEATAIQTLETSIENGWTGIFPERLNGQRNGKPVSEFKANAL